jgi:hypothetical protein
MQIILPSLLLNLAQAGSLCLQAAPLQGLSSEGWVTAGANPQRTSWVPDAAPGRLKEIWVKPVEPYMGNPDYNFDYDIANQAIQWVRNQKVVAPERPFFIHVMTTSNHRPYTYPAGRIDIPSGSGRDGAVKYTDYAIGRFLEQARAKPWFDDTVFVITADHGANARGTTRIPIENYLIPVFVYAPRHVAAQRVDRLMSQIDVPPTLLGLLDFDYYSKFFGRDVLQSPPSSDRAFVANYQTLGYLTPERLVLLQPRRKAEVFRIEGGRNIVAPVDDPQALREAIAFYSTASYVFRNGLYRDEEQTEPGQRAALVRVRQGG